MYFEAQQDLVRAFAKFASLCRFLLKIHYFERCVIAILDVSWMHVKLTFFADLNSLKLASGRLFYVTVIIFSG